MQSFIVGVAVVVIGGYAALTLPTGHLDPCRALMARVMADNPPPPVTDAMSLMMVGAAEAALYQRVSQRGPVACTGALLQHAAGQPITTMR